MATIVDSEREAPVKSLVIRLMLESTTPNGFRLRYRSGVGVRGIGEMVYQFDVICPGNTLVSCGVRMPLYVRDLVRAQTGRECLPAGERFWEAMCEEALSNYLRSNHRMPIGDVLCVVDLTPDLLRWINTVVEALT